VFLSFLSLAPILGRDRLKAWLSPVGLDGQAEERISRWMCVSEWRAKVCLPSQPQCPRDPELELEISVSEKMQMQEIL
jgi:hypothetical protein